MCDLKEMFSKANFEIGRPNFTDKENKVQVITNTDSNVCDECNKVGRITVLLGEPNHHGSATANVCIDCITEAYRLCLLEQEVISFSKMWSQRKILKGNF
jgi:hypothetical protein